MHTPKHILRWNHYNFITRLSQSNRLRCIPDARREKVHKLNIRVFAASCRSTICTRYKASTSDIPPSHDGSTGADCSIKGPLLGHLQQHCLRLPRERLSSAPATKWVRLDQAAYGRFSIRGEMRLGHNEWNRSSVCCGRCDQFDGARLQRHAVV